MKKLIASLLSILVLSAIFSSLIFARDRGLNQPGAIGNKGRDPGVNQPGAVGNTGANPPGRDPGITQPGAVGNTGVNSPGRLGNRRR